MLNSEYPNSKGKTIGVYFTDTFEINEDNNDETSDTMRTIWNVAAHKKNFMSNEIYAVSNMNWES